MIQNIDLSTIDLSEINNASYTQLVQMIQNIDLSTIDLSGFVGDASYTIYK